jgi:hypothetical protein
MTRRSIADDVLFVPLCGEHQGWAVGSNGLPRIPLGLDVGVAGAYLLELAIHHCIEQQGDRVIATHARLPDDVDLSGVFREIAGERPRSAGWWIGRLAARQPHLRQLERLRARRLVSEYDRVTQSWFGKRTRRRCFAPDWGAEDLVMQQLHGALCGEVTDDRTVGLLAILCAGGWHHWFTHRDRQVQRRAERAARNHWIGREVSHLVQLQSMVVVV